MAEQLELRLTLAAYIFGLEEDLRNIISKYIIPFNATKEIFPDDNQYLRACKRYKIDNPSSDPDQNILDLLIFLDFGDYLQIIFSNKNYIPEEFLSELKAFSGTLEAIASIRNRVMHNRPLLSTDYPEIIGFVVNHIDSDDPIWRSTYNIKNKINNDSTYPFSLKLDISKKKEDEISHNLPLADSDETGFIGRQKEVDFIQNYLLGGKRQVITILGEGGVGKTALLLRVLYKILDLPKSDNPFDMIIWISSKASMLTYAGIKEISDSVKTYGGLINGISDQLEHTESLSDNLEIIYEYMKNFNILLALDNLESVIDESVKTFIFEAAKDSTIAITSRLGMGELEKWTPKAGHLYRCNIRINLSPRRNTE